MSEIATSSSPVTVSGPDRVAPAGGPGVPQETTFPPLTRDAAFGGMTATQFLGAFNDNVFKQLVLLICVDYARRQGGGDLYQSIAQLLFALPFILFSGFAGYLSDRFSKQVIVVICKLVEILVMLAGLAVFWLWQMDSPGLIVGLNLVLFLMGTHSAFFGPAKYGILPEMLRGRDLPSANGIFQMTTFLAIIFGTVTAGYVKNNWSDHLWTGSLICVGIAVLGTLSSLLLRPIPAAQPQLKFSPAALGVSGETWVMLKQDKLLMRVLLTSSLFWLLGGVVLPVVNTLGKVELGVDDAWTGYLAAAIGLGIAVGCPLAAVFSRDRVNFRCVTIGAWGIVSCFAGVAVTAMQSWPVNATYWVSFALLTLLGVFSGLFAVPLQVFMQARPPQELKGRMIATMNLFNWVGIISAAGLYFLCSFVLSERVLDQPISRSFLLLGLLMLPIALRFRPPDEEL